MEEKVIASEKVKLGKKFRLAWIILAVFFVLCVILSAMQYSKYKDAQKAAIEFTLDATDRFDKYKNDYTTLVHMLYDFYNPTLINTKIDGVRYNNSEVVRTAKNAEAALSNLMNEAGYTQYDDAECFKYDNFFGFALDNLGPIFVFVGFVSSLIVVFNLLYLNSTKKYMCINGDKIVFGTTQKIKAEFMIRDVKSVENVFYKAILIKGNGIKCKLNLVANRDEIKAYIMESLSTIYDSRGETRREKVDATAFSSADELKKFKDLFDSGVITEEEFEAKKKQLLNL